jgi:hypothetical protein
VSVLAVPVCVGSRILDLDKEHQLTCLELPETANRPGTIVCGVYGVRKCVCVCMCEGGEGSVCVNSVCVYGVRTRVDRSCVHV